MRREGRPHGLVRTHEIPTAGADGHVINNNRPIKNLLTSPATAGVFTRVPSKPTNHSKFTGKCCKSMCQVCRFQPPAKARNKTKGTKKFGSMPSAKSEDLTLSYPSDFFDYARREYEEEMEANAGLGPWLSEDDDEKEEEGEEKGDFDRGGGGDGEDEEGWVVI